MRFAFLLVPLMALAACSGGDAQSNGNAAAPVASATPPAGKAWTDVVSKTDWGGYRMGNPNAPIKLIEYGSRGCPVCGAFAKDGFDPLHENYIDTGKVSLEFREFLVHGPPDLAAALLGQCVATSAYFPVLEQMYANQETFNGRLRDFYEQSPDALQGLSPAQQATKLAEVAGYIDFMKQRGLPEKKARACLTDQDKIKTLSNRMEKAASQDDVGGTPSFFINGENADAITWDQLEPKLKAAGA